MAGLCIEEKEKKRKKNFQLWPLFFFWLSDTVWNTEYIRDLECVHKKPRSRVTSTWRRLGRGRAGNRCPLGPSRKLVFWGASVPIPSPRDGTRPLRRSLVFFSSLKKNPQAHAGKLTVAQFCQPASSQESVRGMKLTARPPFPFC